MVVLKFKDDIYIYIYIYMALRAPLLLELLQLPFTPPKLELAPLTLPNI